MIPRLGGVALLALLLSACANNETQTIANPLGLTEGELIARLGVPARSTELDGRRFLTYETFGSGGGGVTPSIGLGLGRSSGGWGSGTSFGTGLGLSFGGWGGGGRGPCTTTYELRESVVVGVNQQGSGCT